MATILFLGSDSNGTRDTVEELTEVSRVPSVGEYYVSTGAAGWVWYQVVVVVHTPHKDKTGELRSYNALIYGISLESTDMDEKGRAKHLALNESLNSADDN